MGWELMANNHEFPTDKIYLDPIVADELVAQLTDADAAAAAAARDAAGDEQAAWLRDNTMPDFEGGHVND